MHRGCRPFFIHVFAITLALLVHNLDASSSHSVSLVSILGRSINICLLVLVLGVALQILHLGFRSSTALINFPQPSHWSPLASSNPQPGSGQVPSTYLEKMIVRYHINRLVIKRIKCPCPLNYSLNFSYLSAKKRSQLWQCNCSMSSSIKLPFSCSCQKIS